MQQRTKEIGENVANAAKKHGNCPKCIKMQPKKNKVIYRKCRL